MLKTKKAYEINMLSGPIMPSILRFVLPLLLSQVLQLLFNAADMIVLGQYAQDSDNCLAAVGSTTSVINLLISVFMGITVGANIVIANYRGACKSKDVSEAVHTSIMTALIGGITLMCIGIAVTRPILKAMGTPGEVFDRAVLYMQIYFIGIPFQLIYNFGSAVLRSIGDTKRPMFFITLAGIVNIILNLFFVIVLHWDVAGVAIATAVSHAISAILVIRCLMVLDNDCKLEIKKLKIVKQKLFQIMRIGIPSGLSTSLFSISNVLIQSSVNSMGPAMISGNTIASNIGQFVMSINGAFYQASVSFTSQNYGAKNYKRICDILKRNVLGVTVFSITFGFLSYIFGEQLFSLYTSDPEVIAKGMIRLMVMNTTFFIAGTMDAIGGALRGMKRTFLPMSISLFFVCFMRIAWVFTVFAWKPTAAVLFSSYPISWLLAAIANFTYFMILRKNNFSQDTTKGTA